MYELYNNNKALTDDALEGALARIETLVSDAACRFEAGITDTPELGKVSTLTQLFKNAVLAVCRTEKIGIDETKLDANIQASKDGPLFGGIPVGGYERASFKRNVYAREFAEVFRTAMGPEIRSQMIAPLRASLTVAQTPAVKARALVAA